MASSLDRFIVRPVAGAGRFGAFQVWDTLNLCRVGELHDWRDEAERAAGRANRAAEDDDADELRALGLA